ncbi:molybdopterin molybdenumtransferase MoeA, partial [Rothia nasimurium]
MLMSYEESLKIFHSHIKPFARAEKIALTECLGRILAQDIKASKNQPEFLTSAMDGYAIKFEDQDKPLKILGITPAGTMPEFKVENDTCVKTFTGSLM